MGKSAEELRRILQRMQSDLAKEPRREDSAAEEEQVRPAVETAPAVRPSLVKRRDLEPDVAPQETKLPPAPVGWSSSEQEPAGHEQRRWLDPSRRIFAFDSVSQRLILWCAVLTSTAGLYFENMPLAGLGMLWLALRAFSIGFECSNELEDLSKRIAALERRVSRVSAKADDSGGSDIDEDVQELKTLVKTLFKAISTEDEQKEPGSEETGR